MSDNKLIKFEIVTPERIVLKELIRQITLPTKQGEITILPNHIPLIATLLPGVIHLQRADDSQEILSVSGGFVEVLMNKVVVLADTAEQIMKDTKRTDLESFTTVNAQIAKELARTRAVKVWRKLKNISK